MLVASRHSNALTRSASAETSGRSSGSVRSSPPLAGWGSTTPRRAARGACGSRVRASPAAAAAAAAAPSAPATSETFVSPAAKQALFRRAREQVEEAEAAVVRGSLPAWLDGSLVINGGGDYTGMRHMFDGYGLVSKLRFSGGKVFGSQRFIESKAYSSFRDRGAMRWREFATPLPASTPLDSARNLLDVSAGMLLKQDTFTDNASVNLVPLPGGRELLALSESRPSAYRVDAKTLATLAQVKYDDGLPGDLTTAHPKALPDGTLVNFTRSLPFGGYHVYRQDPATLKRTQIAFIPDRKPLTPPWVHDLALSSRHLVIVEPPLYMNLGSLVLGTSTSHVFMDWAPQDGTRVHVVALDGSGVKTFEAPPFFSFHTVNAFESADGSSLCLDLSVYDDPDILNDLALGALAAVPGKNVANSYLRRLTIPLAAPSGSVRLAAPQPLMRDEAAYGSFFEFPAVNPASRGRPYRYAWGMAAARPTNMGNALCKFDLQSGTSTLWHEPGGLAGEAAFLPAPGGSSAGAEEDAGVLIAPLMQSDGSSAVVVLDAASMMELGRAQLPFNIPYRFHGTFVPTTAA